jgi:hypothetical protein
MPAEMQLNITPNSDWKAEHLRLTCFTPGTPLTDSNWWEEICGHPPDSSTVRMKGAHKLEVGKFGMGILSFEVQPGRMDLVLRPLLDEQQPILGIPILGPYSIALAEFEVLASKWLAFENLPLVQRLAFGTPLFMQVETLKEGYRTLARYLPALQIDPDNSSDLSYQINRPRKSTTNISSLLINRLSKWSIARFRVYAPQTEEVRALVVEQYACRLELDINTVPDSAATIPKQDLSRLLSELTGLASEIIQEGDVA